MNRARRAFALVVFVAAIAGLATAQAQDSLFPRPAELEPAVKFWTRVYTEIDTRAGFIHDDLRLNVVYQTVRVPDDLSPHERRRHVERSIETYRNIVLKLASGARKDLNAEERRVLAMFPEGTSNSELRAAAGRLRFQLGQSDRFRAGLIRSGTWKPYIYELLDKRGLPRELAALPHVESSFDPTAYSKVGAAGMWQFTRSTGARYMRVDHIVDERRDPFFASDAAARLLADNHSVVQTWPLALTAYNHGLAGMRRSVLQQKTTDIATIVAKYQSRSFGFASRNFYTAFLAALEIDTHPERYFSDLKINAPAETAVVVVPAFMKADSLAVALNVRKSVLRELNSALMDTVWAGDHYVPQGFELRLPRAAAALADNLIAAIDSSERYTAQRQDLQHRVRRGDTLSKIAAEYHVSLAALIRANDLSGRDVIRVGQLISLPVDSSGGRAAATAVLARSEVVAKPAAPPPTPDGGGLRSYVVRSGDSIERIATRFSVDQQALLAANAITNRNLIFPGQTLQIPGAADRAATSGGALVAANAPPPRAPTSAAPLATVARTAIKPVVPTFAATALDEKPFDIATEDLAAALTPAVLANGATALVQLVDAGDEPAVENALASEQVALAADPSDYTVNASNEIQVQALETLGHYSDWLKIPTQRLRVLNKLAFRENVVIGQMLALDFSRVDAPTFEQRRVAYHQQRQSDFFALYHIDDIESHVIKSGESLWVLAERTYKVPVWLLRQYNPDLNLDKVAPGAVVKFPRLRAVPGEARAVTTVQTVEESAN